MAPPHAPHAPRTARTRRSATRPVSTSGGPRAGSSVTAGLAERALRVRSQPFGVAGPVRRPRTALQNSAAAVTKTTRVATLHTSGTRLVATSQSRVLADNTYSSSKNITPKPEPDSHILCSALRSPSDADDDDDDDDDKDHVAHGSSSASSTAASEHNIDSDCESPADALAELRDVEGVSSVGSRTFHRDVATVARRLACAKHSIVITGAGVSVAAGIPDFRSSDGLYNIVKRRYPNVVVKGKDMFDAQLFHDPASQRIFYTFMAELRTMVDAAHVTQTHRFIKQLDDDGKLLRCYTQNIDSLERKLGMASDLAHPRDVRVVQLHGDLHFVACTLCKAKLPFEGELLEAMRCAGAQPCPECADKQAVRSALGKRLTASGILRPNIVLYNEPHEDGEAIGSLMDSDIRKGPSVVLVVGTSLKVEGIRRAVNALARAVHSRRGGLMVLVNKTRLARQWDSVFDLQFIGCADTVIVELATAYARAKEARDSRRARAAARRATATDNVVEPLSAMDDEVTDASTIIIGDTASAMPTAAMCS